MTSFNFERWVSELYKAKHIFNLKPRYRSDITNDNEWTWWKERIIFSNSILYINSQQKTNVDANEEYHKIGKSENKTKIRLKILSTKW